MTVFRPATLRTFRYLRGSKRVKLSNFSQMHLKQAFFLLRAFTNCFMRPSLIGSVGSITLVLPTRAGCKIFL